MRCNEAEILGTPGPDCEVDPDMVKVPCSKSGPPGAKVDGLGKFVEPCTQVGSGRHSQGAAMLGAEPASVIGELFGVNSGTQQPAYFPQNNTINSNRQIYFGCQQILFISVSCYELRKPFLLCPYSIEAWFSRLVATLRFI